jgi:hypothetical protein
MSRSTDHAVLMLGKNSAVHDRRTVAFSHYLAPVPSPPPTTVGYYSAVADWPMYDNDKWADCTAAAAGHMVQNWTANAGRPITPADGDIDAMYEHFVGNPPPPDAGCAMLDVLRYWRATGLGTDRITAFAALSLRSHPQLQRAVYMFGSAYLGVELPDFACQPGQMLTTPWVVPVSGPVGDAAPNPQNGHCIPVVGYDGDNVYVVTWGELKTMSWSFYDAYTDEAFAVLSKDFIGSHGHTSAGFNFAKLRADLAAISAAA